MSDALELPATSASVEYAAVTPAAFTPAWWCRGPHAQTLWPYLLRTRPRPPYARERFELDDGDFIDVDWSGAGDGPIVIVLHGLEGGSRSHYVRGLSAALCARGLRTAVMHFRGCSGAPNRLARSYHSGETGDLGWMIDTLRRREPRTVLAAVGYSLGGNVLLKWLGEGGRGLARAVAVSVPFELARAAARLEQGFSRVYQWRLVSAMRAATRRKFRTLDSPIDLAHLERVRTFREFDDRITAPLHGFRDAADYYARCSSRRFLRGIDTPTLIIHARDDPFMTPAAVPTGAELSTAVRLELSDYGGHVGFVGGRWPWRPHYWLERRIAAELAALAPAPADLNARA